ncbi:MAG: YceD family protein [Eubacteriales bacterium]
MRIDLTPLLDGQQSELNVEYSYTPDADGPLLPKEIHLRTPVHVRCRVTDSHGYMTLTASAAAEYDTVCDRCLAPITAPIAVSMERLIASGTEISADGEEGDDGEDSLLVMDGGAVEIDRELTETLALELPLYHLCRENCPGLCPKCGKRLADGDCGCSSQKEIDPRFAILQKLLEKQE